MKKYRELLIKEQKILNLTPERTVSTVKEDSQDSKPNQHEDFERLKLFWFKMKHKKYQVK